MLGRKCKFCSNDCGKTVWYKDLYVHRGLLFEWHEIKQEWPKNKVGKGYFCNKCRTLFRLDGKVFIRVKQSLVKKKQKKKNIRT